MKHTQGKWLMHPHVDVEYSIFNETGTVHICDVTTEADSKLIAAAPELLNALQALLSVAPDLPDTWNSSFDKSLRDAVIISKAAIKKATE